MKDPFAKVLDLARQVQGATDQEFTGEFVPDPEEVKAWQEGPDQEYNGEFRYGNKSPTELRRMIEAETDPVEKAQMVKIMGMFIARGLASDPDDPKPTRAGEPYRGEPKEEDRPESILELGKSVKPVEAAAIVGGGRGIPPLAKSGDGLGMVEGPGGVWEES